MHAQRMVLALSMPTRPKQVNPVDLCSMTAYMLCNDGISHVAHNHAAHMPARIEVNSHLEIQNTGLDFVNECRARGRAQARFTQYSTGLCEQIVPLQQEPPAM